MAYTSKYTGAQIGTAIDRLATLNPSADGTMPGINISSLFTVGGTLSLANPQTCNLYFAVGSIVGKAEYSNNGTKHYFTAKVYGYTCFNGYTLYTMECTKSGTTFRCSKKTEQIIV